MIWDDPGRITSLAMLVLLAGIAITRYGLFGLRRSARPRNRRGHGSKGPPSLARIAITGVVMLAVAIPIAAASEWRAGTFDLPGLAVISALSVLAVIGAAGFVGLLRLLFKPDRPPVSSSGSEAMRKSRREDNKLD